MINSSWRMLLDVNPPSLGRVFVYGELKFEDERDYNFTAALVSHILSLSRYYIATVSENHFGSHIFPC